MKSVIVNAPVLTQSGYGVHARQIAKWLLNRDDVDVKFMATRWGNTPWVIDRNAYDGLAGQIMERTIDKPQSPADVSFQVILPNEWDDTLARVNVGVTAAVESDRASKLWVDSCNQKNMKLIVCPSQHALQSLLAAGEINRETQVIGESYNETCLLPDESLPKLEDFSSDFNVLVVGQLTNLNPSLDRKNIANTIKWTIEALSDDPKAGIVIKTNSGRNTKIDRNVTANFINHVISSIKLNRRCKVYLFHGDMSDAEMTALYRHKQIKALATLTHGEGFGLPIIEAAACGLPVIATGWSGHTEFLSLGRYIEIGYKLTPVPKQLCDGSIFVDGARWAEPNEEIYKTRLLKLRKSYDVPKQWAKDLSTKIQEKYSFKEISKQYDRVLERVLAK